MFKKIEIWILYLVILSSLIFAVFFGTLVRQELVGSTKLGWISKTALFMAEIPVNTKKIFQLSEGVKIPDRFPQLNGFNGKGIDREMYLLLSRYDGDKQEGVVELIDLSNFKVLHTWNPDLDKINDLVMDNTGEFEYLSRDVSNKRAPLSHPKLLEDGSLIFVKDSPLRKIDACSNLIFQVTDDKYHHSIETDEFGNIWIPAYLYPQEVDKEKVGRDHVDDDGFMDDGIVNISPNGDIIFKKSVSEIFIENDMEYLLFSVSGSFINDPIHLNDIEPVRFESKYWKAGDVFISLRHQSMVLLYRPSTNEILWKGVGKFFHQHDVDVIDEHRISVFNNNSKDFVNGDVVDGNNELLIYDFDTETYSSYLQKSYFENDIRTITEGSSQIIANGDLFIEETDYGRSLYINKDGSLQWVHLNRANNGNVYPLGWSRILYNSLDLQTVNEFLNNKGFCND